MFGRIREIMSKFFARDKKSKFKYIIIVVLSIFVVVIFIGSFRVDSKNKQVSQSSTQKTFSALEYCEAVENRIINILECVKGLSNVNVYVVVESSPTVKYLEEVRTEQNEAQGKVYLTENTIVFSKDGSVTNPISVVEILPEITGVLIVAKGAGDVRIKTSLTNVVSSVLGVSVSKVEVLEGK